MDEATELWAGDESRRAERKARLVGELRRIIRELDELGLRIPANHASLAADLVEAD